MIRVKLYFDESVKIYYSTSNIFNCDHCGIELEKFFILVYDWGIKRSHEFVVCKRCVNKIPIMGAVLQPIVVLKVPVIPYGAVFSPPLKPHLSNATNLDTFSAAYKNISDEKVIDNTKYALRESWSGANIGAPDMKMIEAKDRHAGQNEVMQILCAKPSVVEIEHKKTNQIEDKRKRRGKNGARGNKGIRAND